MASRIDAQKLKKLMEGLEPGDRESLRADIAYARDTLKADIRQFVWHNLEKRMDRFHDRGRIDRIRQAVRSLTSDELLWLYAQDDPSRE